MHTNEITHDTFIPRWFGRLGNNIQQISNGIYFCRKNGIHFTSPDQPMIEAIDLNFGSNEFKISPTSHNWFYFFEGPDRDFDVDVNNLNLLRKNICEDYILPKLKVNHSKVNDPLPDDVLVIHIRSGDVYSPNTHPAYVQNPLAFYLELFNRFKGNVIFMAEDDKNPIVQYFAHQLKADIRIHWLEDTYTMLLRAKNLATSGIGTFALGAAFCSKNLRNLYATNLYAENALNPSMLKEQLNVYSMDINDNKYIKVGAWEPTPDNIKKVLEYSDNISFRRL
jgi:hypothetical protein